MASNTATTNPEAAPGTPPAVRRNSDPALEFQNQHHHEHLHHSKGAGDDNVVYARTGDSTVPAPSPLHRHEDAAVDVEKGMSTTPEKSSASGGPPEYPEKGAPAAGIATSTGVNSDEQPSKYRTFYRRHRPFFHGAIFAVFTGWWIAGLVLHRNDKNWLIPFLFWLAISLRLMFFYLPSSYVAKPIKLVWANTCVRIYDVIPPKLRVPAGAALTISVMLIGTFVSEESADNTRENRAVSLFGIFIILLGFWVTSRDRKGITWRPVIGGMLAQYVIALFVLRTGVGYDIFKFIADRAGDLLGFANKGTAFLTDVSVTKLNWFLTGVIPPIIFFVAIVQVLYHVGFLQWFIGKFATFVFWALRVSGAEAVVAAATPFIGQGESAMLVRPFVPHMTRAELHQIMTCGFATISGSVLVVYIGMGLNGQAMVSSCVMSIPASIAISKLRYPEHEETLTAGRAVIPDDDEHRSANAIHAFSNGAWLGIKIAGSIIASLLCILALVGLCDGLLTWWGGYLSINDPSLTLNLIFGYILYPVAFLLGVPRNGDILKVSRLIATKVIANEYIAFTDMKKPPFNDMSPRSQLIATYALCGFGNISSLGVQIGILSQLAPGRGGDVARLAVSALISGVFTTLTSAAIAGLVVTGQATYIAAAASP